MKQFHVFLSSLLMLLSMSSTVIGHAIKTTDAEKAFGCVIGKTLKSAEKPCDLIPILITPQ